MALAEGIGNRWRESTAAAKMAFAVAVAVVLVLFAAATLWLAKDDYQVLFSGLEPQDAAAIVTEMERMKVPYRLRDEGRTILVDKDAVHRTRVKVLGNGVLLKGTVGFEIFNNSDFGMTEFAQKINYQRALQGELARTIMGFDEVKSARVHLVMPESGLFKKAGAKPKASITVVTRNDQGLRAEQVRGIQKLVAAAVPEIEPDAVTIVDHRGMALTRNHGLEGESAAVSGRLEMKKEMEGYLTRKIADVLDKAIGPGQSIVSVDVALNHDQGRVTREDVVPHARKGGEALGVVVRKRQSTQVQSAYRDPGTGQQTETTARGAARPGSSSSTVETEYQNGRVVEQIVSAPGAIKRVSVGVLLPSGVGAERVARIREMVSMAVGLTQSRGDAITVYSLDQLVKGTGNPGMQTAALTPPAATRAQSSGSSASAGTRAADGPSAEFLALLFVSVVAIVLVAMLWIGRMRRDSGGRLSAAEREQALSDVQKWLAPASATVGDGGKP